MDNIDKIFNKRAQKQETEKKWDSIKTITAQIVLGILLTAILYSGWSVVLGYTTLTVSLLTILEYTLWIEVISILLILTGVLIVGTINFIRSKL